MIICGWLFFDGGAGVAETAWLVFLGDHVVCGRGGLRGGQPAPLGGGRDRTRTYEPHGCEPCALTN